MLPKHFNHFAAALAAIPLPTQFNNPFYYTPHPLCLRAATELQEYLRTQTAWQHDFGDETGYRVGAIGKMFGVLVVQAASGEVGYLAAFSGKLAESNHHERFVPPVFDILTPDGLFNTGKAALMQMNEEVEQLENDPEFIANENALTQAQQAAAQALTEAKTAAKNSKERRNTERTEAAAHYSEADFAAADARWRAESAAEHFAIKDSKRTWAAKINALEQAVVPQRARIAFLKEKRRKDSATLQRQLFEQYTFLNKNGETKSLYEIFGNEIPPSGAGECAAPKLLQYAFLHDLTPLAMAEFWWGQSPKAEARRQGYFYPACQSKCKPILAHVLQGLDVATESVQPQTVVSLSIIFEDADIVIVNKPHEFLSVAGKTISDSVQTRLQARYPDAVGATLVHRLDMSTSGLLLFAKTKTAHEILQRQFAERRISKRYVAVLDGILDGEQGIIDLPLRVDLDDRPRQLVCYEHGKPSQTRWQVIERKDGRTRVYFFPITGRTHQLRVHAAHHLGLGLPIVGDDLYGKRSKRLLLHAEMLTFEHPTTGKKMTVRCEAEF